MTGTTPLRAFTATLTQRVVAELAATDAGVRPSLRTELPLDNPEAMQAYTLGQTRLGRGGRKDVEEAAEAFRSATEAAPEFVLAYAKWAEALLSLYRHNALRADEALPLAQNVISTALSLDDRSAEAYAALGDLYAERHNLEQSERHFQRALSLNPSCEYARIRYAMLLAGRGRVDEAVEQVDQAQKLNPRSSLLRGYLGATLHYARRFEDAARTYETLLRLDSQYTAAYIGLCKAYTELRRTADALAGVPERRRRAGGRGSVRAVAAREDPPRRGPSEGGAAGADPAACGSTTAGRPATARSGSRWPTSASATPRGRSSGSTRQSTPTRHGWLTRASILASIRSAATRASSRAWRASTGAPSVVDDRPAGKVVSP